MAKVDYEGLIVVVAAAGLLAALGFLVDRLMLPSERNALSDRLTEWWVKIDGLKLPDVPRAMARGFIRAERAVIGGEILSIRWIATVTTLSIGATAVTMIWGDYLFLGDTDRTFDYVLNNPRFALYPSNLLLDLVTIAVTVKLLSIVVDLNNNLARLLILSLDITLALCLGFFGYVLANSIQFWGDGFSTIEPAGFQIYYFKLDVQGYLDHWEWIGVFDWESEFIQRLGELSRGWIAQHPTPIGKGGETGWSNFLTGSTTLVPTGGYLLLLVIVALSFLVIRAIQLFAVRLLRLDVETDKSIFFYSASLVSFAAVAFKVIVELKKLT